VFRYQLDAAHRFGLTATNLISFTGLQHQGVIDELKKAADEHGDELGIHLHEYQNDELRKRIPIKEKAFWLNSQENKQRIVDLIMETFERHFGFIPASVGSYVIDAPTARYIKKTYPNITCIIASCFEEGTNMFRGTASNWHLFNEGGPWWPWYPSKSNILCPAKNTEDAIEGVVALPHLCRDMLLSINDRNDYFASHPGNLLRGKAYDGRSLRYDLNFIDQFIAQQRYNGGYSYYNMFASLPWLTDSFSFEEDASVSRELYEKQLDYFAQQKKRGAVNDCTMSEFARWFSENRSYDTMDSCFWQDILYGSGREAFWKISPQYRLCLDSGLGTALCDIRPYAGRVEKTVGPDTDALWDGSYPYICNAHKRGSGGPHFGKASIVSTVVSYGGASANICGQRSAFRSFDPETQTLVTEPIELSVGDTTVVVENRYRFGLADITTETRVVSGEIDGTVGVTHYISGSVGTTEYPVDIRGITLSIKNENDEQRLPVQYASKSIECEKPQYVAAEIPQVQTKLSLVPLETASSGLIEDEYLFSPYFNCALSNDVAVGGSFKTCLIIEKL
jgi:hypothetical protein